MREEWAKEKDKSASDEEREPFVAVAEACPGCVRIAEEQHNVREQNGESGSRGVQVFLVPYAEFHGNAVRWAPESVPSAATTVDASPVDQE